MTVPFMLILFAALASLSTSLLLAHASFYRAPTFVLDLDKEPEQRWEGSISSIVKLHGWSNSFGAVIAMYEPTEFAYLNTTVKESLRQFLSMHYPVQYRELTGLAKEFARNGHPEMNETRLATWVWFYEFGSLNFTSSSSSMESNKKAPIMKNQKRPRRHTACTGVLALPRDNRSAIIHGRNMDEDPRGGKNCSLDITVVRNSSRSTSMNGDAKKEPLFRLYDWTWWFLAFWTASRPGALTMQWNWRTHRDLPLDDILRRILQSPTTSLDSGSSGAVTTPTAFMFRHVMESSLDFHEAIHYFTGQQLPSTHGDKEKMKKVHDNREGSQEGRELTTTTTTWGVGVFASRFYIIMSGAGRQGAVLSVSFNQSNTNVSIINDSVLRETGRWYMVQTNYDRWKPDPADDPRRTVAEEALGQVLGHSHGATRMGIWATMSTFPVHNPTTMETVIMTTERSSDATVEEAADGCLEGYIRTAMMPCSPGECHY